MATMIRVKFDAPASGVTVDAAAATLGVCLTDELAVVVGNTVPRHRLGSETREILLLLARKPRDPVTVAAGNVRMFPGPVGAPADVLELASATEANATAPDESFVYLLTGSAASALLDRSDLTLAAVRRCLDAFVPTFGL